MDRILAFARPPQRQRARHCDIVLRDEPEPHTRSGPGGGGVLSREVRGKSGQERATCKGQGNLLTVRVQKLYTMMNRLYTCSEMQGGWEANRTSTEDVGA